MVQVSFIKPLRVRRLTFYTLTSINDAIVLALATFVLMHLSLPETIWTVFLIAFAIICAILILSLFIAILAFNCESRGSMLAWVVITLSYGYAAPFAFLAQVAANFSILWNLKAQFISNEWLFFYSAISVVGLKLLLFDFYWMFKRRKVVQDIITNNDADEDKLTVRTLKASFITHSVVSDENNSKRRPSDQKISSVFIAEN